ncbi:kinase-like domain-containing protein [Catenaria anguillulae PL171]|uniref:non-specific serine/threonine protein kinase n=1 Tax=Catenaria anguillulae PL171 TaxID=765915 RepID=A0A1Y2H8N3_9FUNG|nr:kinase-like domain-containing protein [Catenaria anguillulae PL171]
MTAQRPFASSHSQSHSTTALARTQRQRQLCHERQCNQPCHDGHDGNGCFRSLCRRHHHGRFDALVVTPRASPPKAIHAPAMHSHRQVPTPLMSPPAERPLSAASPSLLAASGPTPHVSHLPAGPTTVAATAVTAIVPPQPSPPLSPNTPPLNARKPSFMAKIRESARDVVNATTGRNRSPSAQGRARPSSATAAGPSTPPSGSPRMAPSPNASPLFGHSTHHNHGGSTPPGTPPNEAFPPLSLGAPAAGASANSSNHSLHTAISGGGVTSPGPAPSHGDTSPPPTMERKASLKEALQTLKSRTLSLGRSKSNDATDGAKAAKEGTLADKYGVCEKTCIGKGATAVVRLVHKPCATTGEERVYAVKEFRRRRKNESEREYIKKLTSEFCISSSLHHINVVETIDLIQDENAHWCEVMEYCAGGDLYSVIKGGKMSREEMYCCWKQLIFGVHYLHENGVAHRDIKPENLLLDHEGHLKITDFGVSEVFKICWETEPHLSKGICGSEPYIAPEEFEGGEYDAREVDVWACGIVLYAMVYSGIPWRSATKDDPNYAYYVKYRGRDFEAIDRLPSGCRELMYKILEPNPKARATIKDIMADPWFQSIETCFECREYGAPLPEGVELRPKLAAHVHHVQAVSPPRSRTSSNANTVAKEAAKATAAVVAGAGAPAAKDVAKAVSAAASAAVQQPEAIPPVPALPTEVKDRATVTAAAPPAPPATTRQPSGNTAHASGLPTPRASPSSASSLSPAAPAPLSPTLSPPHQPSSSKSAAAAATISPPPSAPSSPQFPPSTSTGGHPPALSPGGSSPKPQRSASTSSAPKNGLSKIEAAFRDLLHM